jgi:hypothetical protein
MAVEEKKMFNNLLKLLAKHQEVLSEIFAGGERKRKAKPEDLNLVSVKILSEVPSFIGTNMKEYGPYKKGEVVEIPVKIAKLFTSRKIGEIVSK